VLAASASTSTLVPLAGPSGMTGPTSSPGGPRVWKDTCAVLRQLLSFAALQASTCELAALYEKFIHDLVQDGIRKGLRPTGRL
jgi:hypothetical protein